MTNRQPSRDKLLSENRKLQEELDQLRDLITAIQRDRCDGLVIQTPDGEEVFTFQSANRTLHELVDQAEENQSKYQALIETTSDFIWEVDPNGHYTYCSPQMEKLWGINPKEMIGKTPFDQMPPEAKEKSSKIFKGFTDSKKPFSGIQVPSLDGKGNLIFIEISGVPFFNNQGELRGFRGVTRDITERKKAEDALKESEHKFKTLAENASDPIMRFDKNLRITYLNPSNLAATGETLEEVLGKTNEELGRPAELCRLWNGMFDRAKTTKQVQQAEFDFNSTIGARTFNLAIVPEFSEDGSLISYIGISRDVTEHKKAEDAVKESKAQLQEIFDNSIDVLYKRNLLTGRFEYVSQAFERITGFSSTEALVMTEDQVLEHVHPDDLSNVMSKKMNIQARITQGAVDYRFLRKDGTYR